jgi:hypothetical protein
MGDLALGASAVRIRAGAISESESSLFNYLRRHFRPNSLTPSNSPPRRAVPYNSLVANKQSCPVNSLQAIGLSRRADPATEVSPLRSQWAI